MRVTVRLFARLRDLTGTGDLERQLPPESTVAILWEALVAEHPALAPYGRVVSAAVNADYVPMDTVLRDGDEVAFLPPVSGGQDRPALRPRTGRIGVRRGT